MPTWNCGNVFVRSSPRLAKGYVIEGHSHNFDHMSVVMDGAVRIIARDADGVTMIEQEFKRGDHVLIRAELHHEITALEDGTVFWCIYSHRNEQGEVVDENVGWEKSYL